MYLSCVSTIIQAARISVVNNRGWIVVSGFILVVTALTSYLIPSVGGLIGGCFWVMFIIIPKIGNRKVDALVAQQRFHQASRLARVLSWLHPADGWREQPELLRALELGQCGEIAEAIAIFDRHKTPKTPTGRSAIATLYQMDARWEELLEWIQENLSEDDLQKDIEMLNCYLRALGETGDVNGMLLEWERYEQSLEKIPNPKTRNLARMFVLAFCGQTQQVAQFFNGSLSNYSNSIKLFWLATADQASGKDVIAHEQLLSISDDSDICIQNAVARRLSEPVVVAEPEFTDLSRKILYKINLELEEEGKYISKYNLKRRKAFATYFLISSNLVVFGIEERLGGSTNLDILYRLGALVPEKVIAGSWWRVLASAFLHYGFLHLILNMLGLYLFGRLVEFALGVSRFLLLYFICAIGSMLAVAYMSILGYSPTNFAVGASGCVMGLVGAFAAILLIDWYRKRTRLAARSLRGIIIIIILQVIFDLTTPHISFVGHSSGLIVGFVMGLIFKHNWLGRE
ncbi:MAG: rhomboid family intramembrane serine protease [Scytonema sp. PMC 1069.18]|nr:rhomboid family intramembrane serine protease [Scytonema sp. PMC 1069.18]MEC4885293.1 rhomboid family intramembrane serine protease [Scytonema sp. PMC 1070.18]